MVQKTFYGEENRLEQLSELGDPLEKLNRHINWEIFVETLRELIKKEENELGGRPSYDSLLMFKIVILQRLNNISDDRTEYLIKDRLSFQRFLGISIEDKVPDAKTIWLFKEKLKESGQELFEVFNRELKKQGLITQKGSIVDATFIEVPRAQNTRKENEEIKEGKVPQEWSENKKKQKDMEARWQTKNKELHYGYKDHIKVDKESKLIMKYAVTTATVHESQKFVELVDENDKEIYADSGYVGKKFEEEIRRKNKEIVLKIKKKGSRYVKLEEAQKAENRIISKTRARVEHIFGHITTTMNGLKVRCKGVVRVSNTIGLMNLAYNISRSAFLLGRQPLGTA
jgi:IS5 family transposase